MHANLARSQTILNETKSKASIPNMMLMGTTVLPVGLLLSQDSDWATVILLAGQIFKGKINTGWCTCHFTQLMFQKKTQQTILGRMVF